MKNNIICLDLTKFNNEKLKEVSNELNLSYDIVLKNKKKEFAKIFLDGSKVIAFSTKKDKGTINFMDSFTNDLMEMDSFELTDEPVNLELDSVLEKISKYGVDSLSKKEKVFLDNLSNGIEQENLEIVTIGNQSWTKKNLSTDSFRNGDLITEVKSKEEWGIAAKNNMSAWWYYNNDSENGSKYGKLYNWHAVNDARGIAPDGFRIPSFEDFKKMAEHNGVSFDEYDNYKITKREQSTFMKNGTNNLEFDALLIAGSAAWWTSDQNVYTHIFEDGAEIHENDALIFHVNIGDCLTNPLSWGKSNGYSVRCVKDNNLAL